MNTRVPIKTKQRDEEEGGWRRRGVGGYGVGGGRVTAVAAHRLRVGFGLRGLDMKVRHHGLQTLFVFR